MSTLIVRLVLPKFFLQVILNKVVLRSFVVIQSFGNMLCYLQQEGIRLMAAVEEKAGGDWPPIDSAASGGSKGHRARKIAAAQRLCSIVSDVFDGRILSSVQCLTCDTVSAMLNFCEFFIQYVKVDFQMIFTTCVSVMKNMPV